MLINKAHKTELQANNKQASYFEECAGAARFEMDRDLNAAINLRNRAKHARIDACGEDVNPNESLRVTSLKQEASCEVNYA